MNELLKKIESKDLTEDNDLFYLGAALVTKVFEKNKTKDGKKQPSWKKNLESQVKELNKDLGRLLESQVKELNKDLGRLNALLEGKKMKKKCWKQI